MSNTSALDVTENKPALRRYRSASRDEQKRETRAKILDCALRHFSERGFEAASLRDIAAEAGVTHAVIRLHLGGKDELWRAAINLMFERQEVELGLASWENLERFTAEDFKSFIYRNVAYWARHTEHVRIMIHETLRDNERVRWLVEQHLARMHAQIHPLFERAIDEKILVDIPLVSLIYISVAASQTIFALAAEARHLYAIDVNNPAFVQAHADAICKILLRPHP